MTCRWTLLWRLKLTVALYRIAFLHGSLPRSVVRVLHVAPQPGDRIPLDGGTSLPIRRIVPIAGGSIAAALFAEADSAEPAA